MRIALMIEGQEDVSWPEWAALALAAENSGFEALFRSDHYVGLMGDQERGALDAWATICALAAITRTIRLGTMVSPATFRHPAVLYKSAVTADHVSGGRIELGMGAGWNEREHAAYGFAFPQVAARFALFSEQVEIVRRLLTEELVDHDGPRYRLEAAQPRPAPVQSGLPLIIGGGGGSRSLGLAARFADEYNTTGATVPELSDRRSRWARAWEQAARPPEALRFSLMAGAIVGADESEVDRRAERVMAVAGADGDPKAWIDQHRDTWIIGTPEQVLHRLGELSDAGVDRVLLQHLDHRDLDALALIGEQVIAQAS